MKTYLIDFENVKSKGLVGIDHLTEEDSVVIFYSENADTISFEMHQKVMTSKAEVDYFKVHVGGKNALDFQLSTMLGYLVAKDAYSHIFVISNDKCFDYLHDFWHGKYVTAPKCTVYRARNIASAINYAGGRSRTPEELEAAEAEKTAVAPVAEAPKAAVTIVAEVKSEPEAPASVEADAGIPDYLVEHIAEKKPAPKKAVVKKTPAKPAEAAARSLENLDDLVEHIARKSPEPEEKKPEPVKAEEPKTVTIEVEVPEVKAEEKKPEPPKAEEPKTVTIEVEVPEEKAEEKKPEKKKAEPKAKTVKKTKRTTRKKPEDFAGQIAYYLEPLGVSAEILTEVGKMLAESKDKEDFHNLMAKEFKGQATDFYKVLRTHYNELHKRYRDENGLPDPDEVIINDAPAEAPAQAPKAEENSEEARKTVVSARLAELLAGLCSEDELAAINELFFSVPTKQQLYIRMVKLFRKDKGCQFYNAIKGEYAELKS